MRAPNLLPACLVMFVQAISHLIHRDYEAIVQDFVTLDFIPKGWLCLVSRHADILLVMLEVDTPAMQLSLMAAPDKLC